MVKLDIDIRGLTANVAAEEKRLAYPVATAMNRTALGDPISTYTCCRAQW